MQPNSSGASAKHGRKTRWLIVALIIILVLATNATWGWLYSNKRTDFHNQLNSAQQTAKDAKSKNEQLANELAASKQRLAEKDNQKPEAETTTSDYREIPELGVKYKLTDETNKLTYAYAHYSDINSQVTFSTTDLANRSTAKFADPNSKGSDFNPGTNFPLGMWRKLEANDKFAINPTQSTTVAEAAQNPEFKDKIKKVGNFYIAYTSPQNVGTNDPTEANLVNEGIEAVKTALASLEPIS